MDSKQIKTKRKAMGLSLSKAADRLGWKAQRWADLEAGRHPNPRIGTLLAVCEVLGCEVGELLRKRG